MHYLSIHTPDTNSIVPLLEQVDEAQITLNEGVVVVRTSTEGKMDELKKHVSDGLSGYIIDKYEKKQLGRILKSQYKYFSGQERRDILSRTEENPERSESRMKIVAHTLYEYLKSTDKLVLDGFVNFRLQEYKSQLEEVVEQAVDQFLANREYDEFIELLRFFVEMQQPREQLVHVVALDDERFDIYNHHMKKLTTQDEEVLAIKDENLTWADLLVSSLITLAPKRIVFHNWSDVSNTELRDTINKVFWGRTQVCKGCALCRRVK